MYPGVFDMIMLPKKQPYIPSELSKSGDLVQLVILHRPG